MNAAAICKRSAALLVLSLGVVSCAYKDYDAVEVPNYDDLIGKKFGEVVFMGRKSFNSVREQDGIEVLERRRPDGCIFIFGVRKQDDIIEYWRIVPSPQRCLVRSVPFNV